MRAWCMALAAGVALLGLGACSATSGNSATADSATCDHGFLCGDYVDGDHSNSISRAEWDKAFKDADTDGDGQLSQGEFRAGGGSFGGGRR